MKPSALSLAKFVMLYHEELAMFAEPLKRRELQPADGTILLMVIAHMNWKTGKADVTSSELGEELGMNPSFIRNGLSRLKKAGLVAYMREGQTSFYSIHPSLVRSGLKQCRDLTVGRWKREGLL